MHKDGKACFQSLLSFLEIDPMVESDDVDFDLRAVFQSPHSTFTCSKLTIETIEQGVKYIQS